MPSTFRNMARGCLIGTAVGDALGAPVEFLSLVQIRARFGPEGLRGLEPWDGHRAGAITDDTQMTLATAAGLADALAEGVDPESAVWARYLAWYQTQRDPAERRAPGRTCLDALAGRVPGSAEDPLNDSKGCGGVMRVAPAGIAFEPGWAFERGAALAALTHGHPSGYLAAGFLADVVSRVAHRRTALYRAIMEAREELLGWEYAEEVLDAVDEAVETAMTNLGEPLTVQHLGEGWVAEEALAIAIACALAHPEDWVDAVLEAVNHDGDSDSTGAITGALMGVVLGVEAVPYAWVQRVERSAEALQTADRLVALVLEDPEARWAEGHPAEEEQL